MKILHLEDNPRDAELFHLDLLEQWPDCQIQVVASRDDFQAGLKANPDLILSDFNMPDYSGLEALHDARGTAPKIPFIFLSGTIGEDRAIEALTAGASDYVLKDRPKRLIPAIHRVLHDVKLARERQEMEEQMQRVQRLENIGMLAAGIAHDFNNVLTPLLMGLPMLRMRHTGESDQKLFASMESSAHRGAGLVKQILGFAHGVTGEAQLVQPRHLLEEIIGMMRQTFPKNIIISDDISARLWPIKANPTQFHQVLLNLCVNARDAMPKGGTLTVHATNRSLDAVGAAALPEAKSGDYLAIEVRDTGTGIPPEILERIWEPFFTTKGAGKGTGLGLATVRGLVKEHGGVILLQSQLGRGTTFQLLFPATPSQEAFGTGGAMAADVPPGHGELILVVDDDASVREITGAALTGHGYRVLSAADGTEALALFAPRSLEIRAVIADLDMPGLDGLAFLKVVQVLNPSARPILVSGSADTSDPRRASPPGGAFLPKPFNGGLLLRTLHGLLSDAAEVKPAA